MTLPGFRPVFFPANQRLNPSAVFPLLEAAMENAGYLEISFGKTGLCTIPLRAFESDEQKAAFVVLLKRGEARPEG